MSDFFPNQDTVRPGDVVACQNCEWTGNIAEVGIIKDAQMRLSVGEEIPAGECPKCGALCSLKSNENKARELFARLPMTVQDMVTANVEENGPTMAPIFSHMGQIESAKAMFFAGQSNGDPGQLLTACFMIIQAGIQLALGCLEHK